MGEAKMATKLLCCIYQIIFLVVVFVIMTISSPVQPAPNVFTNETSIMMPDNETIIEMRISVKNKDNSALESVSKVLLSPPVMDQIIGAVGKAIEVEDKKEGDAIRDSIRTAFIKMSGTEKNETVSKVNEAIKDSIDDKNDKPKQTAKVTVRLTQNKEPIVTLIEKQKKKGGNFLFWKKKKKKKKKKS